MLFSAAKVFAVEKNSQNQNRPDEVESEVKEDAIVDIRAIPPILDPAFRQQKKHQFEFSPYGGAYLGNTVGQSWMAGTRLYYHFSNTVALGANYGFSRLLTDRSTRFGSALVNPNMQVVTIEAMFSNDAAIRAGDTIMQMDFYATLGVGPMYLNDQWQPAGLVGGGVKFYCGIPWLAFRIDVNNYIHNTSQPGKDIVDFDVTFLGGVSFLFPAKPSHHDR